MQRFPDSIWNDGKQYKWKTEIADNLLYEATPIEWGGNISLLNWPHSGSAHINYKCNVDSEEIIVVLKE